jgi:hypothetical protein
MRVAILGMGPSAETYARHASGAGDVRKVFDEVWTVNAFGSVFKADRIFHMDDIRIQQIRAEAGNEQIANLLHFLQRAEGPIYTSRVLPKEPNPLLEQCEELLGELAGQSTFGEERLRLEGMLRWLRAERQLQALGGFDGLVEYPLGPVLAATGGPPYFTSTTPYAFALALAGTRAGLPNDVTSLAPFGIDYSHINAIKAEVGRACCEFWLGRCIERGMRVGMPEDTWLLGTSSKHRNLYGYDTLAITLKWDGDEVEIRACNKPAPTAAEIEAAYSHADPQKLCAA